MIRDAQEQDLPQILDIYNDAIVNTTAVYTDIVETLEGRQKWFHNKKAANEPIFVYEKDGKIAGFASWGSFRPWPNYRYTIEHLIYVSPDFQGRKIASKLLEKILIDAKKAGYKTIIGGIDASNQASIALHKKYGFKDAGTLEKVGYKFDQWLDLVFYQYMLDE